MHPEHRSIGELAYLLWQARGCPPGTAEKDWLEAEKQLSEALGGRPPNDAGRLAEETDRLPEEAARVSKPAAAKAPSKRPDRARALKPKSVSSKPLSSDSSKPGDSAS